jgi:GNAT superfamily N-acetyltransferase
MQSGVYTNISGERPDGVAVWISPQTGEPAAEVDVWSEMDQMEQRFDPVAYRRFTETYRHFEHIHNQCMVGPHWYLALLGVAPHRQGQGIGGALLTPGLQRADREGLPCYLETFVAGNVPFYAHRGFHVVETGMEPQSHVPFWAMRREPKTTR